MSDIRSGAPAAAAPAGGPSMATERNVFRDYALLGSSVGALEVDENAEVSLSQDNPDLPPQGAYVMAWCYVSVNEIIGFVTARVHEAGLENNALDDAVHTAAARGMPAQARHEDLELLSMAASDVNNAGVDSQVSYLVAQLGPQAAYEVVLAVIQEASQERPADGPRG